MFYTTTHQSEVGFNLNISFGQTKNGWKLNSLLKEYEILSNRGSKSDDTLSKFGAGRWTICCLDN
jgi:hypothetical protein